jgi:hypothetical protein
MFRFSMEFIARYGDELGREDPQQAIIAKKHS